MVSKAICRARLLAFEDLGTQAIYEFEVQDMPVTFARSPSQRVPAMISSMISLLPAAARLALPRRATGFRFHAAAPLPKHACCGLAN